MNLSVHLIGITLFFFFGYFIGQIKPLANPWMYCPGCPEFYLTHKWHLWHKKYL